MCALAHDPTMRRVTLLLVLVALTAPAWVSAQQSRGALTAESVQHGAIIWLVANIAWSKCVVAPSVLVDRLAAQFSSRSPPAVLTDFIASLRAELRNRMQATIAPEGKGRSLLTTWNMHTVGPRACLVKACLAQL